MRGWCLKRCAVFTSVASLATCSSPSPKAREAPAAVATARQPIPAAPSTPVLSVSEAATLTLTAMGDLAAMSSRGTIRILVAPSPTGYVTNAGQQHGAAVDAGKAFETFARESAAVGNANLRVVFIPLPPEQLLAALTAGHGDIIAGRFAHTYEREDIASFSEPIVKDVREVLVTGPGVPPIVSLEDVAGRSIHVRRSSDHFASLTRLNGQLAKINKPGSKIVQVDPALSDEDLLRLVNDGKVPVTLVDQYLAAAWRPVFEKIAVNTDVSVSQDGIYAWVVRKDSPQLLALINDFIKSHDFTGLDTRAVDKYGRR
jgi:membrane-bound lytic murein transglycosylase MltF